jgi:hypothetical protein
MTLQVEADQGRTAVTTWPCEPEAVHGSDASQFTPGLTRDDVLQVWVRVRVSVWTGGRVV